MIHMVGFMFANNGFTLPDGQRNNFTKSAEKNSAYLNFSGGIVPMKISRSPLSVDGEKR
jgi:hypothetical protein